MIPLLIAYGLCFVFFSVAILLSLRNLKKVVAAIDKTPFKDETIKSDPFIEDVMRYAFKKGVRPITMPDAGGKNTLFSSDKDGMISICEMFTTTNKKGTPEYDQLLSKLTAAIDHFVENKNVIKEAARKDNAKTE
jgi:hypothetical protein